MSEKFSATVRISDLNDYIAPSQGCVVSLKSGSSRLDKVEKMKENRLRWFGHGQRRPLGTPVRKYDDISLNQARGRGRPKLTWKSAIRKDIKEWFVWRLGIGSREMTENDSCSRPQNARKVVNPTKSFETEPIKISLKDCLACSGCITSAETVMLEKQGLDEFLSNIREGKAVILSLSPQSRASLAEHYNLSPIQVFRKLTTFFKSLGVKVIFDTSCSRDLTLIESCNEFISRYKQSHSTDDEKCNSSLPMISSSCPGWICYAEKTLGSDILPYISSVKSPQQTIGAIIKRHIYQNLCVRPEDIYHVTVMPCYDKKLEASREDFVFEVESDDGAQKIMITEVDSVLTTGEVLDLIKLKTVDFKSLEESPLDELLTNVNEEGHLYGVTGSSGGYAETIFRHAAKTLYGQDIKGPLAFKTARNADFQELSLEVEGKTVLKFALCYGFRNIQNIKRKIKDGKCDYQFMEVMACPSGCLNGGGQIKPKPGQSAKDLIQTLHTIYMEYMVVADPFNNPLVQSLYNEWLEQPGSEKAKRYMHTQYHPVAKNITNELHNW